MKKNLIHTPHDKLFRASLRIPEVAREFLELYLPEDIKQHIDFHSITYIPTDFIDTQLKLSQADVLFQVQYKGKPAYMYVLAEHESTADHLISFWVVKYMVAIWDEHIKKHPRQESLPLPPIFPLIFYTGGGEYKVERRFLHLFGEYSPMMQRIFQEPFPLVHVDKVAEKTMKEYLLAGTMTFVMRKHFRTYLQEEIRKIIHNLNLLETKSQRPFVLHLIQYILHVGNKNTSTKELICILQEEMSPSLEKEMTSVAEDLMEQGRQEGEWQEKREIAKKMLAENSDPVFVMKITGLSFIEVQALQKESREGSTVNENPA